MIRHAVISACELYRYELVRYWSASNHLTFIMLNPSTADVNLDDPTIRRCIRFAKDLNYGGVKVLNLFAFRATQPSELKRQPDPIGPLNDVFLLQAIKDREDIICAWGAHPVGSRAQVLAGAKLRALKLTAQGSPSHPLYLRADSQPVSFAVV